MKKKILTTLSVVLILSMAALGILAYLTSTAGPDTNVMALGNVDIEQDEIFEQGSDLYPGTTVTKEVTVKNVGESPCYVRTLVAFETIESNTFDYTPVWEDGKTKEERPPVAEFTKDDVKYEVYEYVYDEPLGVGETTPASLIEVKLSKKCTNEDMEKLGGTYEVLVLSQAAQTEGYDTALKATYCTTADASNKSKAKVALDTAFGEVTEENCSDWFAGAGIEYVDTLEELKEAFAKGGYVELTADIKLDKITSVEPGAEVYMDMNGKTITVDQNTESNTLIWVKDGGKLVIDGNGTFDLKGVSTMAIFCPYGELVIENGTFKRDKVTNVTDATTGLFMGAKSSGCNVTINGGYFDPGYYDENAADIEEILAETKEFTETAEDIAKRGKPGDANLVRVAIKDNVSVVLNHSGYGSFKVYGGTFVGANPAWGDEGCMLPTTPNYLRPWSYYQGALLAGQTYDENGVVLPDGYTITMEKTAAGIPAYTVTYNK